MFIGGSLHLPGKEGYGKAGIVRQTLGLNLLQVGDRKGPSKLQCIPQILLMSKLRNTNPGQKLVVITRWSCTIRTASNYDTFVSETHTFTRQYQNTLSSGHWLCVVEALAFAHHPLWIKPLFRAYIISPDLLCKPVTRGRSTIFMS